MFSTSVFKQSIFSLTLSSALLISLISCSPLGSPEATVQSSYYDEDWNDDDERELFIRIRFDNEVVEEDQVSKTLTAKTLIVEPSIDHEAYFEDRETLNVLFNEKPEVGIEYHLVFNKRFLKNIDLNDEKLSFTPKPFKLRRIVNAKHYQFPTQGNIRLMFNAPVDGQEVAKHCLIQHADSETTTASKFTYVEEDANEESTHTAKLNIVSPLKKDHAYLIYCPGLRAKGGNAAIDEDSDISIETHGDAGLIDVSPHKNEETYPENVRIEISFNTPVSDEELAKHIRIEPAVKDFGKGWYDNWYDDDQSVYMNRVQLKPQTQYTITVSQDLKDDFGQALPSNYTTQFRTLDARPRVQFESGMYTVEANRLGYPIRSINVDELNVDCAHIPKDKIPQLLSQYLNLHPWLSHYSDPDDLPWDKLGIKPKTSTITIPAKHNEWHDQALNLQKLCKGKAKEGLYLAELSSGTMAKAIEDRGYGRYPYRLLGNITNLGVLLKPGETRGLVWVTDMRNGKTVSNAKVELYHSSGAKIFNGSTNSDGLVYLPSKSALSKKINPNSSNTNRYSDRYIAMVSKGSDLAVVDSRWDDGIERWNFNVNYSSRADGDKITRAFIQSDRGIYRPGETAHFSGWLRSVSRKGVSIPQAQQITINILDAMGDEVLTTSPPMTEFGGFSVDYTLPANAPLGDYEVIVRSGNRSFRERFAVEEFKPIPFKIRSKSIPEVLHPENKNDLTFNVDYLFGGPVKDADIEFTMYKRERDVRFKGYEEFVFDGEDNWWWWEDDVDRTFLKDGATQTDGQGNFNILLQDKANNKHAQDYLVYMNASDDAGRSVSKRIALPSHPADFYTGIRTHRYVERKDKPFNVEVVALDTTGKPVNATLTLRYSKEIYDCDNDGCHWSHKPIHEEKVKVSAKEGAKQVRIHPKESGDIRIEIEGTDAQGRRVAAASSVWVIGSGGASWYRDDLARMSLITSKKNYKPGETAEIAPQADLKNNTVLVTYERSGVLEARVEHIKDSMASIAVPLTQQHAPNMYVSIASVKPRTGNSNEEKPRFRLGLTKLQIDSSSQKLNVAVHTAKEEYEPGEEVTGYIQVDHQGKPVRAEVALSVADEGILALINYKTPNPMSTFYAAFGLGVASATNMLHIANSILLHTPMEDTDDEEGTDVGDEQETKNKVRSRFLASAFWAPHLQTDAGGRVEFKFTAPDTLTAYRLMAVAADKDAHFGSNDTEIRIRKDLMIKDALPRFLNETDNMQIGGTVHNYSKQDGKVQFALSSDALQTKVNAQELIKKTDSYSFFFPVNIPEKLRQANVRMDANLGPYNDAMIKTLPIRQPRIRDVEVLGEGVVWPNRAFAAQATWPSDIELDESYLEVSVDQLGIAELKETLRYLIVYPYGCLEQTTSRLFGLLNAHNLLDVIADPKLKNVKDVERFVNIALDKYEGFQHSSGLFSLWEGGSRPKAIYTTYALQGLYHSKQAGFAINNTMVYKATAALSEWLLSNRRDYNNSHELAVMVEALYVLKLWNIEAPERIYNKVLSKAPKLGLYAKAYLLRSLQGSKHNRAAKQKLLKTLISSIDVEGEKAFVNESSRPHWHFFYSNVRTTSIILSTLHDLDPDHPLIPKLVQGLRAKRSNGRYSNTQSNSYAMRALLKVALAKKSQSAQVTLKLGDTTLAIKKIQSKDILAYRKSLKELKPGRLSIASDQQSFYTTHLVLVKKPSKNDVRTQGFDITREYLDPETNKPVTNIKVGQQIKVRLQLTSQNDEQQIAMVDPIPAGFEIVNTRLASEAGASSSRNRRSWRWTHHEFRDDQVQAFADHIYEGRSVTFEYLLSATHQGNFFLPAAHVEAMYKPHLYARTDNQRLQVNAK